MPNAEEVVRSYREAQQEHRPLRNSSAGPELDSVLNDAANQAALVFSATTADSTPALITVSGSGELTVHRLDEDLMLETVSYGRLTGGTFTERALLVASGNEEAGLIEATYSNPALESIGGRFTIDCRFGTAGEPAAIRQAFVRLSGAGAPP